MHKIVHADICGAPGGAIIHQCNRKNVWGAGVAKVFKKVYPEAFQADKKAFEAGTNCMGSFTYGKCDDRVVFNVYGQDGFGTGLQTDYDALFTGLRAVVARVEKSPLKGCHFAIPYLVGCGRGGGDWSIVEPEILNIFAGENLTFYRWP